MSAGQVMIIGSDEWEEEDNEFRRVHAITEERIVEPFYVAFQFAGGEQSV